MQLVVYLICGNMEEDMKMTDFPTYPWETLDVYQDNSYCYNIRVLANMSLEIYLMIPERSWYHTIVNHMCR